LLTIASLGEPLHFHCGNRDTATAIIAKLESSKAAAGEALELTQDHAHGAASSGEEQEVHDEDDYAAPTATPSAPKAVRWASSTQTPTISSTQSAVVLYDFDAQGDDELSVQEGESLTVVDKENEEWWTVRNAQGKEGVVPAQYIELGSGSGGPVAAQDQDEDDEDRLHADQEARAAANLAAAREVERNRKIEQRRAIERAAREKEQREAEDHALALKLEQDERNKRERRERRRQEDAKRQRDEDSSAR
jgi:hypothetical protein